MKTIWKYGLEITDYQQLMMPAGAEILSVQTQDGHPCLWALVDLEKPREGRRFAIYGTGHQITTPPGLVRSYIGTFQVQGGSLAFHVFALD